MPTLPFLYLPDAVSLILLILVLGELRKIAILHLRQEMLIIRKELIVFWVKNGLNRNDRGYIALRGLLDSSIQIAPRLSPARLFFLTRLRDRRTKNGHALPSSVPDVLVSFVGESSSRPTPDKLKRLQLDMNLALGTFYLAGSISGWGLSCLLLPKVIRRASARHAHHKIDAFFDLTERLIYRLGKRALETGSI